MNNIKISEIPLEAELVHIFPMFAENPGCGCRDQNQDDLFLHKA